LHGLTRQHKPNFTYFFKVHFHVKGFLEFWWKFANLVSASFLAHSTAQFSFIPALSSHCHSTCSMAMEMLLKIWMMMTTMMMKQGKVEIKCNVYFFDNSR